MTTMDALEVTAFLLFVSLTSGYLLSPRSLIRHGTHRYYHDGRRTLRMSNIKFDGKASSSLLVTLPPDAPPSRSLPEWLKSSDSNAALLGAKKIVAREDGLWSCTQPDISWFGLKLSPVFVNRIERLPSEKLTVLIVDARTDIISGRVAGNVVSRVMERSSFEGGNVLTWEESQSSSRGWTLSADLSLTLLVPLPRLILLPPGFNMIGSKIVKSTCRRRVSQNLEDLREAYTAWASPRGDPRPSWR